MPGTARDVSGSLARQSLLVAAVTLVVDCLGFLLAQTSHAVTAGNWAVLAAVVLVDAALATSPRLSGVVAVAQAAVAVGGVALLPGRHPMPQLNDAGLLVSAYRAGAWLDLGPALLSVVCLVAGAVGSQLLGDRQPGPAALALGPLANAVLPWLVGRYTTARRAYIAELEQRAERERVAARQALAEAIVEERSSIARDLHDVISHHVSAIGVHAGVARLRAGDSGVAGSAGLAGGAGPAGGVGPAGDAGLTASLAAVETSSRAAMADLRRLLDFLHGDPVREDSQPGLGNLTGLLDAVRAAGLETRVTVAGVPARLPESLDLAAYRVVQEMLTNALRHGAGTAEVELRHTPGALTVRTTNPLAPTAVRPDSPHRGLQGIRSRAALFNGTVAHGPDPGGTRWTTTVTFPLDPS